MNSREKKALRSHQFCVFMQILLLYLYSLRANIGINIHVIDNLFDSENSAIVDVVYI
jgi:hypothetical protein